ncbi:MAG: hypothetical protein [Circular genetic element sp.]|nr:MAG: hypothetical protein [Circular genetic element sp.]
MAKKGSSGNDNGWKGFLNYSLGKTDKKKIREMCNDSMDYIGHMSEWLENGYSIKIVWDKVSDCPCVILIGLPESKGDAGYAVSMRHSDIPMAIAGMVYMRMTFVDESNQWIVEDADGKDNNW